MKITFASVDDEKEIKEVLAAGGLQHQDITPAHLQHFLVLIDEPCATLTGVVGLEIKGNNALLRSLAVIEPQRSKGLATQLLYEIEKYANSRQVDTLYLLTLTAERFFLPNMDIEKPTACRLQLPFRKLPNLIIYARRRRCV